MATRKKQASKPAAKRSVPAKKSRTVAAKKAKFTPFLTTAAGLQLPALGAIWPGQGGRFAAIVLGPDGRARALVKADKELEGQTWGVRDNVAGAQSQNDGLANTRAMAAAGCDIANQAIALKREGHADFFIASQDESHALKACGSPLFKKGLYWTSTQCRHWPDYAWAQSFDYGDQFNWGKSNAFRVAFVRSVPL